MAGEPPATRAVRSGTFIVIVSAAAALAGASSPAEPVAAARAGQGDRLALCASCHGANGTSTLPNTPSLAGHPVLYTQIQLFLFREGQRVHEVMNAATRGLSDGDLTALAEHYAKLPPAVPSATPDPALDARGRELAAAHRCGVCHLADYAGRDQMPRLAGQREDYLLKALRDYKTGARSDDGAQMASVLYALTDDDLSAVAHHIAHVR